MPRTRRTDGQEQVAHAEHHDLGSVALVAAGGAVGTGLRLAIGAVLPENDALPLAVVLINLSGAFALGLLLAALRRSGPETPARRATRLAVGTGVLGGYTTYSAFAVDADGLLGTSDPLRGLAVSLGTVVGGVLAAWLGSRTARLLRRTEPKA